MATESSAPSATYDGSCHCGNVSFSVTLSPPFPEHRVVSCNCTYCHTVGYLLVYPSDSDVVFHQGLDTLKEYRFGTHTMRHLFCETCGSSIGCKSTDPDFAFDKWVMNIRLLKNIDLDNLNLVRYDGRTEHPLEVRRREKESSKGVTNTL